MNKDEFQKLKGRRIYQFYLDEETGKITDITDSTEYVKVIRCKDCTYQSTSIDGQKVCMLPNGYTPLGYDEGFCSMAERKDEYVTLHHEDINFIDEDAERAFYESLEEREEE